MGIEEKKEEGEERNIGVCLQTSEEKHTLS